MGAWESSKFREEVRFLQGASSCRMGARRAKIHPHAFAPPGTDTSATYRFSLEERLGVIALLVPLFPGLSFALSSRTSDSRPGQGPEIRSQESGVRPLTPDS